MTKNITTDFIVAIQKDITPTGKKVWQWLDKDFLHEVIEQDGIFYFNGNNIPDYIYNYLITMGEIKGLKHISKI